MSEDSKRINNVDTGMDIGVIGYKEVAGPLGGISIEYQIKVDADSKRKEFKSTFQTEPSKIDSFVVNKTFKEIEYFHNKIKTKHAEIKDIPNLVADNSPFVENKEMRMKTANNFMSFIAKDKVLSSSKLLYSFLGYDPNRRTDENPSFLRVATVPEKLEPTKQKTAEKLTTTTCISDDIFLEKTPNNEEEEEDDLFQEFKKQHSATATFSESSSSLFTDAPLRSMGSKQPEQYADLFAFSRESPKNLVLEEHLVDKTKEEEPQLLGDLVDNAELLKIDDSLSDIWKEMQETHQSKMKPEIKPKPILAPKPSLPRKVSPQAMTSSNQDKPPVPAPRTKPVPAPRYPEASAATTSSASVINVHQKGKNPEGEEKVDTAEGISSIGIGGKEKKVLEMSVITKESHSKDLSAFDILSYIDTEQQAQNKQTDNLDLFS